MTVISIYASSWHTADSYGRQATELARQLERLGLHVNRLGSDVPRRQAPLRMSVGGVLMGYPTNHPKYGALANAGAKLAMTHWESTKLLPGWVEALNACDAVSVATHFVRDVFVNEGVTVPVHVNPLGISQLYQYRPRKQRAVFRFLVIADRGKRKGSWLVGQAFYRAFGDDPSVELVIKAREDHFPARFTNRNVRVVSKDLTERQLARLYADCDCMIFPAYGEGFGFPPREFAATGGIAVATHWSGTADDLSQWGVPITTYKLVPAWEEMKDPDDLWAECDVDALALQMQSIHTMPLKARNAWGRVFSDNVRRLYSWERFGNEIFALWQSITEARYAHSTAAG